MPPQKSTRPGRPCLTTPYRKGWGVFRFSLFNGLRDRSGRRELNFAASLVLTLALLLAGCAPTTVAALPSTVAATAGSSPEPARTPSPSATALPPTLTPAPSETPTPAVGLCSPLEGFALAELPNILSNPFNPPPPGSDNPHQGIDLSFYRYGDRLGMLGLPIQAVLSGTVAMSTEERFPYGYALLIETPLDSLPQNWLDQIVIPTPAPTLTLENNPLTCPTPQVAPQWNLEKRSLYLLYGHMQEKPAFQPGDQVQCGQQIGKVGNSGNSINEHLHFEVRVGPSGASFASMDHYDNAASAEDMWSYCTWRITELFQKIDPGKLLFLKP